jgi:hypothetical protein
MALRANDLEGLVKDIFEIDSFRSKLGDDEEIVVLSFTVDYADPAHDLENFFEMGYEFVMDADVTSGEMDDGNYRVFVEIERGRHVCEQIISLIEGLRELTGIERFKFRYHKSFRSHEATEENLDLIVPKNASEYEIATSRNRLDNFTNFFSNSYSDEVEVNEDVISFSRGNTDPIEFKVINSGNKYDMYESVDGPIMLESKDMAEVMFLTKMIGNYNITKIGKKFIFENSDWAVILEKK